MGKPIENRFKSAVVVTLAKRAANRCSNPDCGAITSGPSDTPSSSVNVGEAAHIYGANPGSARYDDEMSAAARSDITNAIWLCGNCHKLIDDDDVKYPAGLLFEWQKEHEQTIAALVGKAGADARYRYERRHLEEFGKLSYLAERIIVEKGDHWEYKLTAEVLRFELKSVFQRWSALKRGLYMKPGLRISKPETTQWFAGKLAEVQQIARAFSELLNVEFAASWGAPGVAGNEAHIIDTCRLFSEACGSALIWEEDVRFIAVDQIFDELRKLLVGVAGTMIDEANRIPVFMTELFSGLPKTGVHNLTLIFDLPEGWSDAVGIALEKVIGAMANEY